MTHQHGERSYHSFYQLTCGAFPDLRDRLQIGGPEQFTYCNQGDAVAIEGVDDAKEFEEVRSRYVGGALRMFTETCFLSC